MANYEALHEYAESIKNLKKQCTESGMSDDEFKKLYFDTLKSIENRENNNRRSKLRIVLYISVITAVLSLLIYNFQSIYSSVLCYLQDFIYPGLRLLRKLSIPIISLFPSLTEFYHETCLVQNPFFSVVDMDCWPCSSVANIRQVYDPKPVVEQNTPPFIYQTEQETIDLEKLEDFYETNANVLGKEVTKLIMDNKFNIHPIEMFHSLQQRDKHTYIWKFNTMNAAIILRQLIHRPKVVPKFGQSTERYVIIDTSQESYKIPDTECSFSFLIALNGDRLVTLRPAEECKHQCKSLKIELKETYLLWYNWWYWRPEVQPSSGNTTFIAHVGSYC